MQWIDAADCESRKAVQMFLIGHVPAGSLLVAFDLGGTFVFAPSGATVGVKRRLDLFGVLVLSFEAKIPAG